MSLIEKKISNTNKIKRLGNMKKTLLYHVFPVKGNDVWIKNINWLKEYSNDFKIFDRLIISVCIEKNSKDDYKKLIGKHYDLGQRDLVTHTDEDYIKSFFPKRC